MLDVGALSTRHARCAEELVEGHAELGAEAGVEDEVAAAVGDDEKIEDVGRYPHHHHFLMSHLGAHVKISGVDMLHCLRSLADEKDHNDCYEHHSDALLRLMTSAAAAGSVRLSRAMVSLRISGRDALTPSGGSDDGVEEEGVEDGEKDQRQKGEEGLVQVFVADAVSGRLTEVRLTDDQSTSGFVLRFTGSRDRELKELWEGDESSQQTDDDNDDLCTLRVAPDLALHRVTDSDVALDGEGQGQPDARVATSVRERAHQRRLEADEQV